MCINFSVKYLDLFYLKKLRDLNVAIKSPIYFYVTIAVSFTDRDVIQFRSPVKKTPDMTIAAAIALKCKIWHAKQMFGIVIRYLSLSGTTPINMYWKRKAKMTSQDLINDTGPACSAFNATFVQAIDRNALVIPTTRRYSSRVRGTILEISSNTRNSGKAIIRPQIPRNNVISK